MINSIKRAGGAVLTLALTAPVAWADSPGAAPASGGGGFHGPGWGGYGPGPWMMGRWGGGPMMGYGGWGGWMMMLFGAVVLVALLVFIFRALTWTSHPTHQTMPQPGHGSKGLHALDERYAKGEINREEYLQKKQDILGG